LQSLRALEEPRNQDGFVENLLETVENQEQLAVLEKIQKLVPRRAGAAKRKGERIGNRRCETVTFRDAGKRHKACAVRENLVRRRRGLERQARLANPTRTNQSGQPGLCAKEMLGQPRDFGPPTDEARERVRNAVTPRRCAAVPGGPGDPSPLSRMR